MVAQNRLFSGYGEQQGPHFQFEQSCPPMPAMHGEVDRDDAAHDWAADTVAVAVADGRGACSIPSKPTVSKAHLLWYGQLKSATMKQTGRECVVHGSAGDGSVAEDLETCSKSRKPLLSHAEPGRLRVL